MHTPKIRQAFLGKKSRATTSFNVHGLHCASCVARVENAIRKLPGVTGVQVTLNTGVANVDFDSTRLTPEAIRQTVESAGYKTQPKS